MGFRFHKSVKLLPGLRLNLNKKSISLSAGGKHLGVTVNSRGGVSGRVSAPGTGLSYTVRSNPHKPRKTTTRKVSYLDYNPDYLPDDFLESDLPYDLPDDPAPVGCADDERRRRNLR
ncbi:MAG: DUF4236 domain-containing protein [Gemmiger formicilis]|uniref:DUF4236 domain-containing protein n=1 Tax=Gemmiger formicilis TaxID=745368 RepID=UPI003A3422A3